MSVFRDSVPVGLSVVGFSVVCLVDVSAGLVEGC